MHRITIHVKNNHPSGPSFKIENCPSLIHSMTRVKHIFGLRDHCQSNHRENLPYNSGLTFLQARTLKIQLFRPNFGIKKSFLNFETATIRFATTFSLRDGGLNFLVAQISKLGHSVRPLSASSGLKHRFWASRPSPFDSP